MEKVAFLWLALFAISTALASPSSHIVAFSSSNGRKIINQDPLTTGIRGTPCNVNDQVLGPTKLLKTNPEKPKNGTALAAVEWAESDGAQWIFVFYQSQDNYIINAHYKCDSSRGEYQLDHSTTSADFDTDEDGKPDIHDNTGLTAVLISEQPGYELFYHAKNKSIVRLGYAREDSDHVLVLKQQLGGYPAGFSLYAAYDSSTDHVHVVAPSSEGTSIQFSVLEMGDAPNSWAMIPTPKQDALKDTNIGYDKASLPGWEADSAQLGISVDKGRSKILYSGSDSLLRSITVEADGNAWMEDVSDTSLWPIADSSYAPFGLVNGPDGDIWVYFSSGGHWQELYFSDGQWRPANILTTAATSTGAVVSSAALPPAVVPSAVLTTTATFTTRSGAKPTACNPSVTCTEPTTDDAAPNTSNSKQNPSAIIAGSVVAVLGVAIILAAVWVSYRQRRDSKRRQAALEQEMRKFDEWRPCNRPSLEHIRPYDSLGDLHWDELRRTPTLTDKGASMGKTEPGEAGSMTTTTTTATTARDGDAVGVAVTTVHDRDAIGVAL